MKLFNGTSIFTVNVFHAHIKEWKQKKKEILSLVDFDNKDAASYDELIYTDHNLYGIKKDKKGVCPYREPFLDMLFPYLKEFKAVAPYNELSKIFIVYCNKWFLAPLSVSPF